MLIVLGVLAVSTVLNAVYFGRTVITLFRTEAREIAGQPRWRGGPCFAFACAALAAATVALGLASRPVLDALRLGLDMFG